MYTKLFLFQLLLVILFSCSLFAQQDNIWVFGRTGAGVDFNGAVPVAVSTNISGFGEASAMISDENGQLLFYTEGTYVWDRNGNLMPNGSALTPIPNLFGYTATSSTAQGAAIVPIPGSDEVYYIFSLVGSEGQSIGVFGHLYYSTVDMKLRGGLGDVVSNQKAILLSEGNTERMIPVRGTNCNIWLLSTRSSENSFVSYNIDLTGIDTSPTLSFIPSSHDLIRYQYGNTMAVSNDHKWIALASSVDNWRTPSNSRGLSIYKFDPSMGIVSDEVVLDSLTDYYSVCFSPDGSKLYGSSSREGRIYQFDLSFSSIDSIIASRTSVGEMDWLRFSHLRQAVDGKIYFHNGANILGSIELPDIAGSGCLFNPNAIQLLGNANWLGFPNVLAGILPKDTIYSSYLDTLVCLSSAADNMSMLLEARRGYAPYRWSTGEEGDYTTISQPGIYWVMYEDYCQVFVDTFSVAVHYFSFDLGADTFICNNGILTLDVNSAAYPGAVYHWSDGSNSSTLTVKDSGVYWLSIYDSLCIYTDSIKIDLVNLDQFLGDDVILCRGENFPKLTLNANADYHSLVLWSNGSTGRTITIEDTGVYWVSVSRPPCFGSDTIRIIEELCACTIFVPNVFSPNGDGVNDIFKPVMESNCPYSYYVLRVFNRLGELVYQSNYVDTGWDGSYKGKPADVGTYYYDISIVSGTQKKNNYKKGDVTLIR